MENKANFILNNRFLQETLPVLENGRESHYDKLTAVFRKLITDKAEDQDFFKSPVQYLKNMNVLPFYSVEINNRVIPVVDDKSLASTIKKARRLYQEGKIRLGDVASAIVYSESSIGVFAFTSVSNDTFVYQGTSSSTFAIVSGRSVLKIDNVVIGPLVSPKEINSLKQGVAAKFTGRI